MTINRREGLTLKASHEADPTNKIFVFWPTDAKVGVEIIKEYVFLTSFIAVEDGERARMR